MPRGGKRLGCGRKPHTRRERWLGGNASKRPLAIVPRASPASSNAGIETFEVFGPPAVLTEDESAYWQLWAPLATHRGTLTPETVPGFTELCQIARRKAQMWGEIEGRGLVHEITIVDGSGQERHELKKHPIMAEWRGLVKQTEQMMYRFGLTADGKVAEPEANPDQEEAALARILAVK